MVKSCPELSGQYQSFFYDFDVIHRHSTVEIKQSRCDQSVGFTETSVQGTIPWFPCFPAHLCPTGIPNTDVGWNLISTLKHGGGGVMI